MVQSIYHNVLIFAVFHLTGSYHDTNLLAQTIEQLLATREAQRFLHFFPNTDQRYIIENHLRYCPYSILCGYTFDLMPHGFARSCCEECSCDISTCSLYSTCCPDMDFKTNLSAPTPTLECHLIHLVKKSNFQQDAIFMHATCPAKANDTLRSLCTRIYGVDDVNHIADVIPVTDKHSGNIYRNKFCAFCNNVSDADLSYWYPITLCKPGYMIDITSEENLIKEIFSHEFCDIKFEMDHSAEVKECTHTVSTCNETGLWQTYDPLLETACAYYRVAHHQTKIYDEVYRNIFCMLCNGRQPQIYQCPIHKVTTDDYFPFTRLLNFTFFDASPGLTQQDHCDKNSKFDPFKRQCRVLHCSPLRKLKNGKCFKLFSKIGEAIYVTYIRLKPDDVISIHTAHALAGHVQRRILTDVSLSLGFRGGRVQTCSSQMIYKADFVITNNDKLDALNNSALLYYDIQIHFRKERLHNPDLVIHDLLAMIRRPPTFMLNNKTVSFTMDVRDDTGDIFNHYRNGSRDQNMSDDAHKWMGSWSDNLNEAIIDHDGKALLPYIETDAENLCPLINNTGAIRLLTVKNCTMFEMELDEFEIENTIDGIMFSKTYLLKNSDFHYSEQSLRQILVCTDTYLKLAEQIRTFDPMDTETLVSILCVSISICALVASLITFLLCPELRTLPGKNNMSLVASLLTAQSVYMIGSFTPVSQGSVACKALGIAMHFCWLHYVSWMNICTFHMFQVFCNFSKMTRQSHSKRFCAYHIYSIVVPIAFVGITVVVSYVTSAHGDIGYGATICYISSPHMVGYTFGVPVAILLLANIGLFALVIVQIRRTGQVQKDVKHERHDIAIIVKLSTLTGMTWVFGFVYSFTKMVVFSYLFIFLNASQGLFLFLSFVINRRVLDMYRCKISSVVCSASASRKAATSRNASASVDE